MFQFPPHHLFIRSPPHSSYSVLVTLTVLNSSVFAKSAIPFHASREGSSALTISIGISGGRMGRKLAFNLSTSPGNFEGEPVTNTFYVTQNDYQYRQYRSSRTFTKCLLSLSGKRDNTFCSTSPSPAESTPAILGENHASQTRHLSVFKWIRAFPAHHLQVMITQPRT
jgi:hypothetical protein